MSTKTIKLWVKLSQITLASCLIVCLPTQAASTTIGDGCLIVGGDSDNGAFYWPVRSGSDRTAINTLSFDDALILTGLHRTDNLRRCFFRTEAELTNPDSTCDLTTPEITTSPGVAYVALIDESTLKYCAYKYSVDLAAIDPRNNGIVIQPSTVRAPILNFEEPIDGRTSNGIANVRGWVVSDSAVTRIDLYVDGVLLGAIPHGGSRPLVGDVHSTFPNADHSGFSMAYGFSNLSPGAHTMEVRVFDGLGQIAEQTNSFFVAALNSAFIGPLAPVNLSGVSFIKPEPGDSTTILKRFRINNAVLDGVAYDLLFEWNSATQKFEMIEID